MILRKGVKSSSPFRLSTPSLRDGKGETELKVKPKGYKVLWVISGKGDKISLKNPYGAVKKLSKVEEKNKGNMLDLKDVMYDGYSMNNQQPIL